MSGAAPVTVLFVAWAPFFSGAERALMVLLEHLDPTRFRSIVALGTRGQLGVELRARGIATAHAPIAYSGVRSAPSWLWSVGRLVQLARKERARVIHANDVPSFQPGGYAARLLGLPALTHVRFPDTRAGFAWFLKPGFDRALFVSAALRDAALGEAPGLFERKSDVVYDGVRIPDLPDEAARRALRAELGLPHDRVLVAFTGQVSEIKGIWEFIDAAGILAARNVPATFVVLGDDLKGKGALRERAEALVAQRGLADRVRFLGFRADAPRLIPCFDIVTVPSHIEPLGNATLEAMAAGRPVVGSRVGGIPEMIVDGVTGTLVPPRDATALAAAVEALVHDAGRRRALGEAGRRRAAECFGAEAHARRVQAVYERLLEKPRRPAVRT
jgi:glycosyltransferase involved in cell wall biosynthesis